MGLTCRLFLVAREVKLAPCARGCTCVILIQACGSRCDAAEACPFSCQSSDARTLPNDCGTKSLKSRRLAPLLDSKLRDVEVARVCVDFARLGSQNPKVMKSAVSATAISRVAGKDAPLVSPGCGVGSMWIPS